MLRVSGSIFLLAALPLTAAAQTRHEHHRHVSPTNSTEKSVQAANPGANTPATRRTSPSAFARYQRFTDDEPLKNWREVNDTVRAIGGWQAYGTEAARGIEAEKKHSEKEKGAKP